MSADASRAKVVTVASEHADEDDAHVGVVTRAVSWMIDALLINLVAIITGLGLALISSVVHIPDSAKTALQVAGGALYVVWSAAYFVVFWATTGQTPGARVMQIRLVTAKRQRVKPIRSLVRWVGMQLAILALLTGYLPVLFGRRAFPDWLARTLVIDAPDLSLALQRQAAMRAQRWSPNGAGPTDEEGVGDESIAERSQG
jgi:uncharacterized RDD family membrane protein YckC